MKPDSDSGRNFKTQFRSQSGGGSKLAMIGEEPNLMNINLDNYYDTFIHSKK